MKAISHIHSLYSYDGTLDLTEITKEYCDKTISYLFITEHAEKGFKENDYNKLKQQCIELSKNNITLIPGLEFPCVEGYHILGINIDCYFKSESLGAVEVIKEIKQRNGIAILAHPSKYNYNVDEDTIRHLDAIEVINTNYTEFLSSEGITFFNNIKTINQNIFPWIGIDLHLYSKLNSEANILYLEKPISKSRMVFLENEYILETKYYTISKAFKITRKRGTKMTIRLKSIRSNIVKKLKKFKFHLAYRKYKDFKKQVKVPYPLLHKGELEDLLVIAPHPDDDVIGCGGIIKKYIDNGRSNIKVLFITDGRYGSSIKEMNEVIRMRKFEAYSALKKLGVSKEKVSFLNIEDGMVKDNIETIAKKINLEIEGFNNIFVPFIFDNHPDHENTTRALAKALIMKRNQKTIWMYEIWSPNIPNVIIDITKEIEAKKEAINTHTSQVSVIDYSRKVMGLNSYRSISSGDVNIKYCESFYKCNSREFIKVIKESR